MMRVDGPVKVYVGGALVAEASRVEVNEGCDAVSIDESAPDLVRCYADIMHNSALARKARAAMTRQQREYWRELERLDVAKDARPNRKQRRAEARKR